MLRIRDYDPSRDSHVLRACFVDLQDFERRLDLRIPPGEQVADFYLDLMFQRCRQFEGVVLVADVDRVMVGFVTILTRYCSSEPDDDPRAHGFVTVTLGPRILRAETAAIVAVALCLHRWGDLSTGGAVR